MTKKEKSREIVWCLQKRAVENVPILKAYDELKVEMPEPEPPKKKKN